MAGGRPQGPLCQHSNCTLRAHSTVDHLSGLGLGNRRQRASPVLCKALRFGHGVKRPHSPDHAESRGQSFVPHRDVDRVPPASTWDSSLGRPHESARGPVAESVGYHRCELSSQWSQLGSRRLATRRLRVFGFRKCARPGGNRFNRWLDRQDADQQENQAKEKPRKETENDEEKSQYCRLADTGSDCDAAVNRITECYRERSALRAERRGQNRQFQFCAGDDQGIAWNYSYVD